MGTLIGASGRAHADPKVDDMTRRALDLRRDGDDEGALVLLRQAFDQSHSPRSAAQLGMCEQALGRWPEAEAYLSQSLKSEQDPWIRKNRGILEQALGAIRSHIARVEIMGDPVDAEVLINGSVVGKLPLASPIHVSAGELQVEVRAPGYAPGSKSLHIDAGQYQKIVLRLERSSTPPPQALVKPATTVAAPTAPATDGSVVAATATEGPPAAVPPLTVPASEKEATSPPVAWRGAAKWVAWGGAVVALGVGVYGTVRNSSLVSDFDGGCGIDPATGSPRAAQGSQKTNAQCSSLKSSYTTAAQIGIGGFVGAGVLGALGLVLWLTEPTRSETGTAASHAYACAPLLASGFNAGMGCAWRF